MHVVPEGRLPLSLSPRSAVTPQRFSVPTNVETLCAALRHTQHREEQLIISIQNTLERMNRTPGTPPHVVFQSCSSPEILTVDAKSVWSRSRSPQQHLRTLSDEGLHHCNGCVTLQSTVQALRAQNDALKERHDRLEVEVQSLRACRLSPYATFNQADATPSRRMDQSNVLLHDSTQKLLAEAERQLMLQDMSRQSTF